MDATAWDERYAETERLWSSGPNRFLPDLVHDLPTGRALDVACGEGRNAIWLAQEGWSVVGVDFSITAVERAWDAARMFECACEFYVADLREWEPPGDFDLVAEFYLHAPKPDLTTIRRRVAGALRQGGRYVVVGHAVSNLGRGQGGPQDESLLHTVESVLSDLSGLEAETALEVERPMESGPPAIDVVVRARAV